MTFKLIMNTCVLNKTIYIQKNKNCACINKVNLSSYTMIQGDEEYVTS